MKKSLFIIGSVLLVYSLSGCYYDKKELVYPQNTCDTTATTYTKDIKPLLATNCNNCHSSGNDLGGGIVLDDYASVKTAVSDLRLLNSVIQDGTASNMPKGGAKLSDCSLNKIQSWINKGMPQ